jgi:hypothetical protein
VKNPEKQALATAVAFSEHDVHADCARNININLHIVGTVEFLQSMEVLDELFV